MKSQFYYNKGVQIWLCNEIIILLYILFNEIMIPWKKHSQNKIESSVPKWEPKAITMGLIATPMPSYLKLIMGSWPPMASKVKYSKSNFMITLNLWVQGVQPIQPYASLIQRICL